MCSAPEEDYISVHIRVAGDFTSAFASAIGCDFGKKGRGEKGEAGGKVVGTAANPPINRVLPRVMVDGPFGSASEDFLNYETVLLVGAGIGVTPFASILKSIWYRMNNFNNSKPTRLSKVYFTWVIRDFGSAEWFHSLLHAIEEQDTQNRIEINIYLTAKIKEEDMNNIIVQDVGAEKDAITNLRAPTHFGRPNWDRVFSSIAEKHPETDVGVFFCGPAVLSRQLHTMSNKYSSPKGTKFFFGKGASLFLSTIYAHIADCLRCAQQRTSKVAAPGVRGAALLSETECTIYYYSHWLLHLSLSSSCLYIYLSIRTCYCCRADVDIQGHLSRCRQSVGSLAPVVCTRPFVCCLCAPPQFCASLILLVIVFYILLVRMACMFGS